MLTATYIHSRGIGPKTERTLWRQGAQDWQSYLVEPLRWKLSPAKRCVLERTLEVSAEALEDRNAAYFASVLPPMYHWRAYSHFGDSVGYLDIETNGGYHPSNLTMIGLHLNGETYTFLRGQNLHRFPELLAQCSMLVTFFGAGFDIPFLRRCFPLAPFEQMIHVDLCPMLHRLGLKGGLKSIETSVGIERSPNTAGLNGLDAVRLWNKYRRGDEDALETLIAYNREDVQNLVPLMRRAYVELCRQTGMPTLTTNLIKPCNSRSSTIR